MKETPVSNLAKAFLWKSLEEGKRPDGGRRLKERRKLQVFFGRESGCCMAYLGETKVLARVSCNVGQPRPSRPNEGLILINVDFNVTSCPRFAQGGSSSDEEVTEVNRLLERLLKESHCVDAESLCIIAEEKVWVVRVDVRVLNHDGNVADAAGVAALGALSHFKRPDATVEDGQVKIHPYYERDPVPLSIHHYPVLSTFGFFKTSGTEFIVVTDPGREEEQVMDGKLVLGMNPYKEICTLHLAGHMMIDKEEILRLANNAATEYAKDTVNLIRSGLEKVHEDGFAASISVKESILNQDQEAKIIDIAKDEFKEEVIELEQEKPMEITKDEDNVVEMVDDEDDDVQVEAVVSAEEKVKAVEEVSLEDESSEEETTTISGKDNLESTGSGRQWYKKKW